MNSRILIVDDEINIRRVLRGFLEQEGYLVTEAKDGMEALSFLKKEEGSSFSTLITDLRMPQLDGLTLLQIVSKQYPSLPVIMITAFETVESAVSALKLGAFDYISKPFDKKEMLQVIQKSVNTFLSKNHAPHDKEIHSELVNQSSQMKEVLNIIKKVANSSATVLITGESGTGKELVARALHENSSRLQKPFIAINCSAIPATLIESELFGYEKGAFTGAAHSKPGRFELADEGTLFLDEIGEIPMKLQAKLLRVLQENEIERVGGVKSQKIDIRLICATNKDLGQEVQKGNFREDLFYRLNVVPIFLSPLRERKEDLSHLVDFFIQKYNKKLRTQASQKKISHIDVKAMNILSEYKWPGNIRQLENVIERMIVLSDDNQEILDIQNLPSEMIEPDTQMIPSLEESSLKEIMKGKTQTIEKNLIVQALEETHGNVTQAARKLGISRKGLQNKMKEYQLR